MKKITISLVVTFVAFFTFIACRKNVQEENNTAVTQKFTIADAKEWWWGTFKKSTAYKTLNQNAEYIKIAKRVNGVSAENFVYERYPSWSKAKSYSIGSLQIVEVPILYTKNVNIIEGQTNLTPQQKKQLVESKLERLVIISQVNGKKDVLIQTITPNFQYALANNFDISKNTFKSIDKNFSGIIETRKWDETLIINRKYENGIVKKVRRKERESTGTTITNSDFLPTCPPDGDYGCVDGHQIDIYYHVCFEPYTGGGDDPTITACSHAAGENTFACSYWYCPPGSEDPTLNCDNNPNYETLEECICALYGIGCSDGGGGEGEENCATLQTDFNNAIQNVTSPSSSVISDADGQERDTTLDWIVTHHPYNIWRVKAKTNIVYQRTLLPIHPSFAYSTNIKKLKTTSAYEGTNVLANTTWTPEIPDDNILDNNTYTARTKTTVKGSLHHECTKKGWAANPLACVIADETVSIQNSYEITFN